MQPVQPASSNIHFNDRFPPILLKKSFLADDPNFSGPLMRSTRGDVRDHIDLNKRNREPSYWS
jgi:hypothetical protein